MDFLKNKTVRLVASVLLVLSAGVLILGGIEPETITALFAKVVACVTAIIEVVSAIIEIIEKDEPKLVR